MTDAVRTQKASQWGEAFPSHEENGLPEISNSFLLDEAWVPVGLSVDRNRLTKDEPPQPCAFRGVSAVHVPRHDKSVPRRGSL